MKHLENMMKRRRRKKIKKEELRITPMKEIMHLTLRKHQEGKMRQRSLKPEKMQDSHIEIEDGH